MYLLNIYFLLLGIIPEPGILLHGYIRDDSCLFSKEAKLTWSITPEVGGETYTFDATTKPIANLDGLIFYRVHIPLATQIAGCQPPAGAVIVNKEAEKYIRQLSVEGTNLVRTDTITLSAKDRGTFRRWSFTW